MSILVAKGLVKSFGRRRVVDGVTLHVEPGELVGLLGPNGAGKTTTFRMICGMLAPDRGNVFLRGEDVTHWPMYIRARQGGMGYLPQQSSVFAKLTVEQNILAILQLLGVAPAARRKRCDFLLDQFQISHLRRARAGQLSGGERRRLEIARCLVSNPEILMLDEPFAGIDPVTVQNIQGVIRDLKEKGISILITDHAAREILQITDRTYVVSDGRILCSGTTEEIVQHEEVKRKYLGETELPYRPREGGVADAPRSRWVAGGRAVQQVGAPFDPLDWNQPQSS
jgi:lipopolysaccharide export system ATP-binding protein